MFSLRLCSWCPVQKIFSYASEFKTMSYVHYCQIQGTKLRLSALIHLGWNVVQGDKYGSICIYLHAVRATWVFEDAIFFHLCISGFKNQVSTDIWTYVWVFDLIPLIKVSIVMPILCCFITKLCSAAWKGTMISLAVLLPSLSLCLYVCVVCLCVSLCFHMKLKIVLSSFVKNWNFDGACIESIDCAW